jgi:hypothetical protein
MATDELQAMWKWSWSFEFGLLSRPFPRGAEEIHEKLKIASLWAEKAVLFPVGDLRLRILN